jgi:hypothetical protein
MNEITKEEIDHMKPVYCTRLLRFLYKNLNLTLTLLTERVRLGPNNASRWQMGLNRALKELI